MAEHMDQDELRVPGTELLVDGTTYTFPTEPSFLVVLRADQLTVSKTLNISHADSGHSDIVLIPQPTECGGDPLVCLCPLGALSEFTC